MVSRIAILPARGDPFSLMLAFHFFEKVWQDEVDRLFILVNSPVEREVIDFIHARVARNPKVVFLYADHALDHGPALTQMFKASNEKIVIFIEDDSIIFKKGIVDKYCRMIESGECDCVGSPRGCCSWDLINAARTRFNLPDVLVAFWPCFFFARRSDLLKTDLDFAGKVLKAGQYVAPLDWTPEQDVCGDTFVWMSLQLRALGLRFHNVEQYHGNSGDMQAYHDSTSIFDGICPWMHNGTLSSAIEDIFTDDNDVPLAFRKNPHHTKTIPMKLLGDKEEIERRLTWSFVAVSMFWDDCEEISEFRDLYKKAIVKFINRFGLNMARMNHMAGLYFKLIGLLP